jgi:hypothetical protein
VELAAQRPSYRRLTSYAAVLTGWLLFCWAQVRRGFSDIAKAGNGPIADEALARVAKL